MSRSCSIVGFSAGSKSSYFTDDQPQADKRQGEDELQGRLQEALGVSGIGRHLTGKVRFRGGGGALGDRSVQVQVDGVEEEQEAPSTAVAQPKEKQEIVK